MDEERFLEVELDEKGGVIIIEIRAHGVDKRRATHVAAKVASLFNGRWKKAKKPIFGFDSVVNMESDIMGSFLGEIFKDLL